MRPEDEPVELLVDRTTQPRRLGALQPPYGGFTHCMADLCGGQLLTEATGAYLHRNLNIDKLMVLCGPCSEAAELHVPHLYPLVAL